ncbi:MAG: AprI/Inh family metalloprotease inhibitor [Rhabdaerophilum sp.]
MQKSALSWSKLVLAAIATLALAACESSQRLGSFLPGSSVRAASPAAPAPLTAAPGSDASTEDLPPPPGSGGQVAALPPPAVPAAPAPNFPQAPPTPATPSPGGVATAPGNLPPPRTAPIAPSAPAAAPTRTGVTGNWSLTEGAGNRCRLTLSSAPKLDLYGAGTTGCSARELQRVNAWELAGSEVILYEPGGAVVARLRQAGDGYSGVSTRSGAPISMSK